MSAIILFQPTSYHNLPTLYSSHKQLVSSNLLSNNNQEFLLTANNSSQNVVGYIWAGLNENPLYPFKGELFTIKIEEGFLLADYGLTLFKKAINEFQQRNISSFLVYRYREDKIMCQFYETFLPDFISIKTNTTGLEPFDEMIYGWNKLPLL